MRERLAPAVSGGRHAHQSRVELVLEIEDRLRDGGQRVAVAELMQSHRPSAGAGRQVGEELVGAEGAGGQGGEDGRGEERAGQGHPAGLVEDDAHLGKPRSGPALGLGDEQPGPTQPDQGRPQPLIDPVDVIGHAAEEVSTNLAAHGLTGDVTERLLLGVVGEVHAAASPHVLLPSGYCHRRLQSGGCSRAVAVGLLQSGCCSRAVAVGAPRDHDRHGPSV